jgi:hypothetical protein
VRKTLVLFLLLAACSHAQESTTTPSADTGKLAEGADAGVLASNPNGCPSPGMAGCGICTAHVNVCLSGCACQFNFGAAYTCCQPACCP